MKDIRNNLLTLLKEGFCTPQISKLAKKLKEPSTTIHYNIKKLEKEGAVKAYKAVLDGKKTDAGFTVFALINLSPDEYGNPEHIAQALSKYHQVESIDICTGDWEIVAKIKTKDQESYYEFVKTVLPRRGIIKIKSLTSLKQVKSEFIV